MYRTQFPSEDQTQMLPRSDASPPPVYNVPPPQPLYVVNSDSIQVAPGTHPVTLIAIVSLFCMPIGTMMNRQYIKALVALVCMLAIGAFTLGIGGFAVGIMAYIDAVCVAGRLNRGEIIGQWTSF